jgi:hypothetical protein
VIGDEPMNATKCSNAVSYSSSYQLHANNCDAVCFRSNYMKKNTGNCNYQKRTGKIILSNTIKERVVGELPGNVRPNFLSVALKQRKVSLEGRLTLSPH